MNIELARKTFKDTQICIFGTPEHPLFNAIEVGILLGVKNIKDTISKFDDYERDDNYIINIDGEPHSGIVLTELGLQSLILKSNKSIAKEFRKWVFVETLPNIRKMDDFISQNIQKLETQLEESQSENSILRQNYKPVITYHKLDINDFTASPCVYLFHLKDNDYKFGVSGEVDIRHDTHLRSFRKEGCDPKLVKIWKCESMQIMKDTELKIKRFAKQNNILVKKYNKSEIIETDDINYVILNIDKYVIEQNARDVNISNIRKLELEIEIKQLDVKSKELNLELLKFNTENPNIILQPVIHQDIAEKFDPVIINNIILESKEVSKNWIKNNPPYDHEPSSDYYNRYKKSINSPLSIQKFTKEVSSTGYRKMHGKINYWTK